MDSWSPSPRSRGRRFDSLPPTPRRHRSRVVPPRRHESLRKRQLSDCSTLLSATSAATKSASKRGKKDDTVKHYYLLGRFMNSLWKRDRFCDVTLRIGDRSFTAHRFVLMAHSSFFQAKLGSRKFDGIKLEVCLEPLNIKPSIFQAVLQYMYTREIGEMNHKLVGEMIRASRLLGISGLDALCEDFLWNQDENPAINVISILKICNENELKDLKYLALYHYAECYGDLTTTKEFMELPFEDVVAILDSDVLFIKGESDIFKTILRWLDHDLSSRANYTGDLLKCVRFSLFSSDDFLECSSVLNSKTRFPNVLYGQIFDQLSRAHMTIACHNHGRGDARRGSTTSLNKLRPREYHHFE